MAERVEHWFNRKYREGRRDVYLYRTPTGWQVVGRVGGSGGKEVSHYLDNEDDARKMAQAMRDKVPPGLNNWALMPQPPRR